MRATRVGRVEAPIVLGLTLTHDSVLAAAKLGEHNSWHKQTNFELATRVPLIIKAPGMLSSHGRRCTVLAELVDVYPTLAELAGAGALAAGTLDGISLVPAFADPTITAMPSRLTYNKTVAYTQYPGQNSSGCNGGYVRGGKCESPEAAAAPFHRYMGFSVRSQHYRYTLWLPATYNFNDSSKPGLLTDWSATNTSVPPRLVELYRHRGGDGAAFADWPGNDRNVAAEPAYGSVVSEMHRQAEFFFRDSVPAAHPVPP